MNTDVNSPGSLFYSQQKKRKLTAFKGGKTEEVNCRNIFPDVMYKLGSVKCL